MLNIVRDKVTTIDDLAIALKEAKAAETAARNARLEIEELIIDAVGSKEEGAFNADGDNYRLTTTGKLNRKIDDVRGLERVLPGDFFKRLVKVSHSIDTKELRYLHDNEPDIYKTVSGYITTKPAKTAVSVKALGE